MGHDPAYGERLLFAEHEQHQLSRRHSAAALLQSEGRRCRELWRHWRGDRPRADAWIRRRGAQVRRRGQRARLVDGGGWQGFRGARRLHREGVQRLQSGGGCACEREADAGRECRGQRRHPPGIHGADGQPRASYGWQAGWLHAATAVLPRLRPDLVREFNGASGAHAGGDQSALARRVPHKRSAAEYAGVSGGVLVQGGRPDGFARSLPRLVKLSLRLDLFDVLHQIVDSHVADIRVRTQVPEEAAPHRHILRAMRDRLVGFPINDVLHFEFGELATALLGDLRQIRRRYFERAGGGSIAFTGRPVAHGAILPVQILARNGRGRAYRHLFHGGGRLLRMGRAYAEADRQQAQNETHG